MSIENIRIELERADGSKTSRASHWVDSMMSLFDACCCVKLRQQDGGGLICVSLTETKGCDGDEKVGYVVEATYGRREYSFHGQMGDIMKDLVAKYNNAIAINWANEDDYKNITFVRNSLVEPEKDDKTIFGKYFNSLFVDFLTALGEVYVKPEQIDASAG